MCYFCYITKEKNTDNCIFRNNIPTIITNNKVPDINSIFTWEEIEHPVMKGIDILGRPFIIIKMIIGKLNVKAMQCFFFGYSLGRSIGYVGTYNTKGNNVKIETNLIITEGGMNLDQYDLIKRLVNGECVKITEKHKLSSNNFIGHYLQTYDHLKWEAVLTIQKYWRLCRYNPIYKMCKKVQYNNFNELYKEYQDN